jgi:hypothetical protein
MDEAAGLSLDVVAYAPPQEPIAVNAQRGEASHGPYWHRRAQAGKPDLHPCRGRRGEVIERRIRTEPERFDTPEAATAAGHDLTVEGSGWQATPWGAVQQAAFQALHRGRYWSDDPQVL